MTLEKEFIESIRTAGNILYLTLTGYFVNDATAQVDLLIVGDGMKKGRIQEEIHKLEAEIGAELTYAVFETKEFIYRLNMFDKLLRDILDFPHEVVLESKELSTQALKKD